jgi:hypothetical protein
MRPGTYFAIEVEAPDAPSAEAARQFHSEAEALAFASQKLRGSAELLVACLGDRMDHGNCIISPTSAEKFDVRVLEHRGFVAQGVTRDEALRALAHWLPAQDRLPELSWIDE